MNDDCLDQELSIGVTITFKAKIGSLGAKKNP